MTRHFSTVPNGVIDRIIQSQNLDVDVVSGATYSSRGIISAVKNALTGEKDKRKDRRNPGQGQGSTTLAASMDAGSYKDGVYYIVFGRMETA